MDKTLIMAAALFAASTASTAFAANSFTTWIGSESTSIIKTGISDGKISGGFWFYGISGGYLNQVKFDWYPAYVPPEPSAHKLDGVVRHCEGICGTAVFDTTKANYSPASAEIGFYVLRDTLFNSFSRTGTTEGDASSWGGLCVTYTSDLDIKLELNNTLTQPSLNQSGFRSSDTTCYVSPIAILPASQTGNKIQVAWSSFEQPYMFNCNSKLSGEEIAKQLQTVSFKLQGDPGSYKFNICAVGPYDGACPENCEKGGRTEIKNIRQTAAKAILSGRSLHITGVTAAIAEVVNLQGQVVAKSAIENASSLNLAHLDAGIYLVRVTGNAVNYANKILLK